MRLLATTLTAVAVLAVGCSSSKKATTSTTVVRPTTSTSVAAGPSTTSSSSTPSTSSALSGTWSGHYSGGFTGTFTLTWQQSGSTLAGTINLSTAPGNIPLNGTVSGSSIRFGTVGSAAITYTGSVSGNSMSGTYQVAGSTGGPWSATKTS